MKCVCGLEMAFLNDSYDSNTEYAHDMYYCRKCDLYCKENVWKNKSLLWIYPTNQARLDLTPFEEK